MLVKTDCLQYAAIAYIKLVSTSAVWWLQQRVAQEVLTRLKEHPDAWTRVDTILEFSSNQQTKYYALQILENVIKTRWKVLPRTQCEGKAGINSSVDNHLCYQMVPSI